MIGLGSNRLSVCRRGGMSVTQAGKGGMEWLAGGRLPSWASPYSAAATAALKAQFPTQWPTIRDYGFAHPEIVGYMNANPLGFGELIAYYQMCYYIESTGTQNFTLTPTISTSAYEVVLDVESTQATGWMGANGVCQMRFGSYAPVGTRVLFSAIRTSGTTRYYIDGVQKETNSYNDNGKFMLFNMYNYNAPCKAKMYQATYKQSGVEIVLYPCYNKTSGVIGMFDVINRTFYTNAGSGTFLKGSDIYYPGQTPAS